MNNNMNVLDEINKGCFMGIDALDIVIKKVSDTSFKEVLEKQYEEYVSLTNRIDELYKEYSDKEAHETNMITKAMTWYGIEKDTMMDDRNSKLADLLINGTNMGIIEGRKLLNNKKMDKKVHKLCCDYTKMQENYIEKLKKLL